MSCVGYYLLDNLRAFQLLKNMVNEVCKAANWPRIPDDSWMEIAHLSVRLKCCFRRVCLNHCQVPFQQNGCDCGVYVCMFMKHIAFGGKVNGGSVPGRYLVPTAAGNLNGLRLLLLEEAIALAS